MNTAGLPFRTLAHALTSSLRQTAPASSGRICSRILLSQSTPFSSVAAAWPRKTSPITPIGFSVFKSNIGQPSPFFLSTRLLPVSSSSSRTSSIAQFHWTRVSPATHRSEVSRSFGTGYGYRRPPPRGPFRRALDSMPGNAIIWGILGINGVIFVAWYVAVANARQGEPSLYIKMRQHFTLSAENVKAGRFWVFLTCVFSHQQIVHMLFNSLAIYTIAPSVLMALGNTSFLALYLGSGILSSGFSYYWHRYIRPNPHYSSLGASGSMCAVMSFLACLAPQTTFLLFGIVPLPAWGVVTGLLAWDGYNTFVDKQNGIDTAGHVGGIVTGILWFVRKRFGA